MQGQIYENGNRLCRWLPEIKRRKCLCTAALLRRLTESNCSITVLQTVPLATWVRRRICSVYKILKFMSSLFEGLGVKLRQIFLSCNHVYRTFNRRIKKSGT